jgi:amidase
LAVQSLADVVAFNQQSSVELELFGQEYFEQALVFGGMQTEEYLQARETCLTLGHTAMSSAMAHVDVMIAPAYATAWTSNFETGDKPVGGACTSIPAVLGWPIVTIPAGLANGLPVGLAFIGRAGSEGMLISAAAEIERSLGLTMRPNFSA